jgi:molybdate transport system substrate-binding protein
MKKIFILLFMIITFLLHSEESVTVAGGAGYKRPINKINELFQQKTGIKIDAIYGNMQQIMTQIKESGKISIVFGDKDFLQNPSAGLNLSQTFDLGKGKLVLAVSKGKKIKKPEELLNKSYIKICLPDKKNAVYGKAGMEFLNNAKLYDRLEKKLIVTATVPQASTYLVSNEVDAAFINITDALGIKDQIGGYIFIDEKLYSPIEIIGGVIKDFEKDPAVLKYIEFLGSEDVKKILKESGL